MKLFLLLLSMLLIVPFVSAHCPLCTGAIVAAAGTATYFGVDASIVGLFVGAFGVSTGLWIGRKIRKRIPFQLSLIVLLSFVSTILPLFFMAGEQFMFPVGFLDRVFFFDKMIFGSFLGGIFVWPSFLIHEWIKKVRGRVFFPYQGIAITVGVLLMQAVVLFFVFGRS